MFIIVEGPDRSGKSTLVRRIARELHVSERQLLHRGPPTQHPLDEYVTAITATRFHTEHIICDRWHLGEEVYPVIFNRASQLDAAVSTYVDMFLAARGAFTLVLAPPEEVIEGRYDLLGDDPILLRTAIGSARQRFITAGLRRVLEDQSYSTMMIHTRPEPPRADAVVRHAITLRQWVRHLDPFITYVGPPRPSVLLLGDVRGIDGRRAFGFAPAFMPFPATSGHYLMRHLAESTLRSHVGLANACDTDNPVALWHALGRPAVVALGERAYARCHELELRVGAAPHPQYVRRFHHVHGAAYVEVIAKAAQTGEDLRSWRP